MIKARKEEGGQIKIYGTLPSKFRGATGNYAGGFHLLNEETWQQEGFFDVQIPEYNRVLETLGDIYFDESQNIFTYHILSRTDLPTLEEAKANKIKELKEIAKNKFNETDWYYIREIHTQKKGKKKEVPTEVVTEREKLYDLVNNQEQEIRALADLETVLTFEINFGEEEIVKEKEKEEIISAEPPVEEITDEEIPISVSSPIPTPPEATLSEALSQSPSEVPPEPIISEQDSGGGQSTEEVIGEPVDEMNSVSTSLPIPTPPEATLSEALSQSPSEVPPEPIISDQDSGGGQSTEGGIEEPMAETKVEEPPEENQAETAPVSDIVARTSTKKSKIIAKKKSTKVLAKKLGKKSRQV